MQRYVFCSGRGGIIRPRALDKRPYEFYRARMQIL